MKDTMDSFIIEHSRSMSQQEIADKLGVHKSTVSRRMAALRESGDIDDKMSEAMKREAQATRERLQGCTIDRTERLEALAELKDLLHAELALSGGQGLARVSSEYRATIEQMEMLSTELHLTTNAARKINPIDLLKLKRDVEDEFADKCDRNDVADITNSILRRMNKLDIVSVTPLDMIRAEASKYDKGITIKKPLSDGSTGL